MKKRTLRTKVFALSLAALTACAMSSASFAEEETTEEVVESVEGALEGVTLSCGTSGLFAPFSYYDETGMELIGFDIDFMNALSEYLGFEIDTEIEAMDYAALTASVSTGKLDIAMAALCATDERRETMNFSETYYDSGQTVAINTETSPEGITGPDSLESGDFKVAVEKGTASDAYAVAHFPEDCIEVHDTITTAYESLEQGRVDCLLQDLPGMAYYIKTKEDTKLAMVGDEFNQGQAPYAVAISFDITEEYPEIVDIFNQAIVELTDNGTFDELVTTWFGEGESVEGALEGVTLKCGTSGLFAPFSYYDETGMELIGFDIDFMNALSEYLGFEIDTEIEAMDYAALTASVSTGKLDIAMAALCATDERRETMNFSETYYDSGQIVAINTETSPEGITGPDSLESGDFKVAVEKGTASDAYAVAHFPEDCIEVHDTITTAYESLEQGRVDCLLQDLPGMAYYIKTKEDTKLAMVGDEFNQGQAPYAVAISFDITEEYPEIVDIFNQAIDELTDNGTFEELTAIWFE